MFKSNLKTNELLRSQIQKHPSNKGKINIIEYFLNKNEKHSSINQKNKMNRTCSKTKKHSSKSKTQNKTLMIEISTTLPTKQNSPNTNSKSRNTSNIKKKFYNHLKNKSLNCNNYFINHQNLSSLKTNLFKNYNTSTKLKPQSLHRKNTLSKTKNINSKSINLSVYGTRIKKANLHFSRSNSISNLEQTTTLTSSTTTTSKRINQKKEGKMIQNTKNYNVKVKKENKEAGSNIHNQFLHTEETNYNYQQNITEVNVNYRNQNYKSENHINIIKSNNTLNEYDLLSEDSVFNPSKHTSNNVTNNNSKDKNIKTISGNNDSGQQTISYTYSDEEGSSLSRNKEKSKKNIFNYFIESNRPQRNLNKTHNNYLYQNNILIHNEDFLTFCEEMNQKLFAKK